MYNPDIEVETQNKPSTFNLKAQECKNYVMIFHIIKCGYNKQF